MKNYIHVLSLNISYNKLNNIDFSYVNPVDKLQILDFTHNILDSLDITNPPRNLQIQTEYCCVFPSYSRCVPPVRVPCSYGRLLGSPEMHLFTFVVG